LIGMYRTLMLLLVFLLELVAIAVLAWWGFALDAAVWERVLVGIGLPSVAAVLWSLYAAPRARFPVPAAAVTVKILVYAAATLALAGVGHVSLAVMFLALVLLVTGLVRLGRLDDDVKEGPQ
jgi:Protein of unknown function (DUF2568)